jgi:Tfp pilus assembly protein PilN
MMIRVNLLPQDYRRKTATPMAVLLPAVGSITLVLALGFGWAWLHFAELTQVENGVADLQATLQSKAPALAYVADLKEEHADFENRKATIKEIASSRILWTKKLDEFFDIATNDDNGSQYLIWLSSLDVKRPGPSAGRANKTAAAGETMTIKGHCFADKNPLQHYNLFHAALKRSDFFHDFASLDDPSGKAVEFDDGMKPANAWAMDLTLTMKPRDAAKPEAKPKASPAKAAEAPKSK